MLKTNQKGAVLVEFAICTLIFWIFFVAVLEFGRALVALNAANESMRIAVRMASICNPDPALQSRIWNKVLPLMQLTGQAKFYDLKNSSVVGLNQDNKWLEFEYYPDRCAVDSERNTCEHVRVGISGVILKLNFPGWTLDVPLPSNSVTVVRESMRTSFPTGLDNVNTYCS